MRIDTRCVGREENGQEGQNGDQCCTQQRHGCLPANGCHGLHTLLAALQIDQDAVDDHNRIIDQHTHGEDEGAERDALHGSVQGVEEQEGAEYGDNQADADDESALETHRDHQDENHDHDRFDQVDYERTE